MSSPRHILSVLATTAALLATVATQAGCIEYLEEGELGRARYFGEVRGVVPLNLMPPISDRDGNVYVLYGSAELTETAAHIGHARGGWTSGCNIHQGDDRGAHGWVGRGENRAWYWSGDALVGVSGVNGACSQVLETDPSTGSKLIFQGVIPLVIDTPSRRTVAAMVQTAADVAPFHVLVDLDLKRYSNVRAFEPAGATEVKVVGVGSDRDSRTGFAVVRYEFEGNTVVEGLFFDEQGNTIDRAPISGASAVAEDAVLGYLQSSGGNVIVGLLETGELIKFDRSAGAAEAFVLFDVVGIHKWNKKLYAVGQNVSGEPSVAPISELGAVGEAQLWTASITSDGRDELNLGRP